MNTVTNTNDFRRYSYQYDPAYLISGFDVSRASHAPKLEPQTEQAPRMKVRENTKVKSPSELRSEQKLAAIKVGKIAGVAVVCLVMIFLVINSFAVKNELTRELASEEIKIANAHSEYVSLQSQLDAMVSISMIDEYAVNELGMTKVKSNQIQYMDVSEYKQAREAQIAAASSPADMAKQLSNN